MVMKCKMKKSSLMMSKMMMMMRRSMKNKMMKTNTAMRNRNLKRSQRRNLRGEGRENDIFASGDMN